MKNFLLVCVTSGTGDFMLSAHCPVKSHYPHSGLSERDLCVL